MDQQLFDIKSEDEDIYRHTYQEERRILVAVKGGDVEEAMRLSKEAFRLRLPIGSAGFISTELWHAMMLPRFCFTGTMLLKS